jgi:hypothetical protein
MAAKPLDWVSWSDARWRMPEIWSGWQWNSEHADRAMVNSLRRGNVPYRGEAHRVGEAWSKVPLSDVVAGLLSVTVGRLAEYEQASMSSGFQLGRFQTPPRPVTHKRTVELFGAELDWDAFRDDLIRFELPAGVKPTDHPRRARAAAKPGRRRVQRSRGPRPFWREGDQVIDRWLEDNGRPAHGDGNQACLEKHIADWLQGRGDEASEPTIRRHVQKGIERYRAKVGA